MEKERQTIILTNMTMLYNEKGEFLVQLREKKDWPGINFPGGHVEKEESLEESAIREFKEETGLILDNLEQCGVFEWNVPAENLRHLCILYRSNAYHGSIHSSKEGKVFFLKEEDLDSYPLSMDFREVLAVMKRGIDW